MPIKRPRICKSSSFDDASFLSQVSPLAMGSPELRWDKHSAIAAATASANEPSNSSAKQLKPSELVADRQSRPNILTVASPETDKGKFEESFEGLIGGFLQKCYFCKKKICEDAEVFMYGYGSIFLSLFDYLQNEGKEMQCKESVNILERTYFRTGLGGISFFFF